MVAVRREPHRRVTENLARIDPEGQRRSGFSDITLPPGESASRGRRGHVRAALPGRYRVRPSQKEGEDVEFPV